MPLDAVHYMGLALSSDCSLVGMARLLADFDDNIHLIEDIEEFSIWQMHILSLYGRLQVP
jgi:hypothetical protein